MGTAITMSSYTKPTEDVYRTCLVVTISNSAFSLVGGFASEPAPHAPSPRARAEPQP